MTFVYHDEEYTFNSSLVVCCLWRFSAILAPDTDDATYLLTLWHSIAIYPSQFTFIFRCSFSVCVLCRHKITQHSSFTGRFAFHSSFNNLITAGHSEHTPGPSVFALTNQIALSILLSSSICCNTELFVTLSLFQPILSIILSYFKRLHSFAVKLLIIIEKE